MHRILIPILLVATACGGGKPETEPAPEPAAEPAPEPATDAADAHGDEEGTAGEVQRMEIELDPEVLTYDEGAGTATFAPGSHVKSSAYTTYEIDLASLEAALGGRPEAPVTVTLEISDTKVENVVPDDPMASAPAGGFEFTTHTATVVAPE